jgi:hypothetical protein
MTGNGTADDARVAALHDLVMKVLDDDQAVDVVTIRSPASPPSPITWSSPRALHAAGRLHGQQDRRTG